MGVYIYSVRTKSVTAEIEGKVETIFALSFLTRSLTEWDGCECRHNSMLIGKAESVWQGREAPKFVAFADEKKFADGQAVYEWDGRICDYDTPKFSGAKRLVGYLRKTKQGRKTVWTVEPSLFSVKFGTTEVGRLGPCFHVRRSATFFTAQEAMAHVRATLEPGETAHCSASEVGTSRARMLTTPTDEEIEDVAGVLLHGAWPVKLWEREAPVRARTASYLAARGLAEVHAEKYEGEGEAPPWHGELSYRLTEAGLRKVLGVSPKMFGPAPKLTKDRVVFTGGRFGDHSLDRHCSSLERVKAHWAGYCEAQERATA